MGCSGSFLLRGIDAALRCGVLCMLLCTARAGVQSETKVCAKANAMVAPLSRSTGPVDTGVRVERGDIVYITVDPLSAWTASRNSMVHTSNAGGHTDANPWCRQCACRTPPVAFGFPDVTSQPEEIFLGTLVYKIDVEPDTSKGLWQVVGTHTEFVSEISGNVFLAYWDGVYEDNDGCIEVRTTKMLASDCDF